MKFKYEVIVEVEDAKSKITKDLIENRIADSLKYLDGFESITIELKN